METRSKINLSILCYIPNLIGHFRLALALIAHSIRHENLITSIALYSLFAALDGLDGWAARKLNQCSAFGAWWDVIVDNVGRTLIWSNFEWGILVSSLEWITFVCNHCHGSGWREKVWKDSFLTAPGYVKKVMQNGFKTPLGVWAIAGLHVLPIFMFAQSNSFFDLLLPSVPLWLLISSHFILLTGRILCAMVELWCIQTHVKCLLTEEADKIY